MKISRKKRILCTLLAVLTLFVTLITDYDVVHAASAKERVETFVGLAAGKSFQNAETMSNLTQDELQFLGVYLSNFFIPFNTELGTSNTEVLEEEKAQMVTALSNGMNFNNQVAESLVETIIGLSRSNNQALELRVSAEYLPTDNTEYVTLQGFPVNYYTFLNCMLGDAFLENNQMTMSWKKDVYEVDLDEDGDIESVGDIKYKYGYFGYVMDGNFIPMLDFYLASNDTTASQQVFAQCLNDVNYQMGVGTNFFDLTKSEAGNIDELQSAMSDWTNDFVYQMTAYGAGVRVDCFGNIIYMGGNHQYIIIPGCMNPYTWVGINDTGDVISKAGEAYQLITFKGMSLADSGNLLGSMSGSRLPMTGRPNPDAGSTEPFKYENGYYYGGFTSFNTLMSNFINLGGATELKGWLSGAWDKFIGLFGGGSNPDHIVGYEWRLLRNSTDSKFDNDWWGEGSGNILLGQATESLESSGGPEWYWGGGPGDEEWDATTGNNYVLMQPKMQLGTELLRGTTPNQKLKMHVNMVFIDQLGAFGFDSSNSSIEYNAINYAPYLDDAGNGARMYFQNWLSDPSNGFSNLFAEVKSGNLVTSVNVPQEAIVTLYTSYALAGLYVEGMEADSCGKLGWRMNREGLPEITKQPIVIPSSIADDIVNNNIRNWVYYLLHPTQGIRYVTELVKNKVNGILVGWHNDMVGTKGVGITTGTTLYRTNYGYVTTPDLTEIQWASTIIDFYNSLIPGIIIIVVVMMLLAFVTGIMPIQRAFISAIAFSLFLLLPVNVINQVVGTTNRLTSNIYGEKFTYWALVQEETYGAAIDAAAEGDSYTNYLKTLYSTSAANQGGESIVLKWQAPKKMASLMLSSRDNATINGLGSSLLTNSILTGSMYTGQTFLDGSNQYLYRDYSDIANFSRYIYNGLKLGTRPIDNMVSQLNIADYDIFLKDSITNLSTDYARYVTSGYTNGSSTYKDARRIVYPLTSDIYKDAVDQGNNNSVWNSMGMSTYMGINQDMFNFSVAMFNNNHDPMKELILNNKKPGNDTLDSLLNRYSEADLSALAAYGLMSESPFYYYSWKLYDDGMSTSSAAYDGYRRLLLSDSNGGYFYNNIGNGELKDFMDMRSLFTYIIPYLKEGNDVVRKWDEIYGIYVHDGVYTEEGHINDTDIRNDPSLRYKYWHNLNVARLYEIYTPWVDLMYDCSYAKPTYVHVMGEKYFVEDPLNPNSYPVERPMVFSESEMYDYGITEADLTAVEKKILQFNRNAQERMYELLNYYNFSDLSLNTAAAINCTFEFNTVFSENGLFKDNINLYPQAFEIKDFSYDAFLRFIISNSTGESLTAKGDFYENLVASSSTTTAILLLILDILSQYLIPAFKIFILIAVFLSSILLVFVGLTRVDPTMKFIPQTIKSVLFPMAKFFAITMGFALVISLFMGVGNNSVTQTNNMSISMGDPNIVMLSMCAIDILCLILYFNIIKGVVADIKKNSKLAFNFSTGVIGGAFTGAAGFMGGMMAGKNAANGSNGGTGTGRNNMGNSSGNISSRAMDRSADSSTVIEKHESDRGYEPSIRIAETNRETTKFDERQKEPDKDKVSGINDKIRSGAKKVSGGKENEKGGLFHMGKSDEKVSPRGEPDRLKDKEIGGK